MAIVNKKTGETTYIGMVLYVRGTFRMDTSMDEVLIWNAETKTVSIKYIMGDTWATVDASPETKQAYYDSIRDRQAEIELENIDAKKQSLQVGSTVKVVRGRNVPLNTIAKITRLVEAPRFTMIHLDNGLKTYSQNVVIDYNGQWVEPLIYIERTSYFQAI